MRLKTGTPGDDIILRCRYSRACGGVITGIVRPADE